MAVIVGISIHMMKFTSPDHSGHYSQMFSKKYQIPTPYSYKNGKIAAEIMNRYHGSKRNPV